MDNISKLLEIGPRAQTNHWLWGKKKYGAISSEMVRWGRAWGCDSLYCCHAIFPQNSKKFAICIFHDHPSILLPPKMPKTMNEWKNQWLKIFHRDENSEKYRDFLTQKPAKLSSRGALTSRSTRLATRWFAGKDKSKAVRPRDASISMTKVTTLFSIPQQVLKKYRRSNDCNSISDL